MRNKRNVLTGLLALMTVLALGFALFQNNAQSVNAQDPADLEERVERLEEQVNRLSGVLDRLSGVLERLEQRLSNDSTVKARTDTGSNATATASPSPASGGKNGGDAPAQVPTPAGTPLPTRQGGPEGCPTDGAMQQVHNLVSRGIKPVFTGENIPWDPCKWNVGGDNSPFELVMLRGWEYTATLDNDVVAVFYGDDQKRMVKSVTFRFLEPYARGGDETRWVTTPCVADGLLDREDRFGMRRDPQYHTVNGNITTCPDIPIGTYYGQREKSRTAPIPSPSGSNSSQSSPTASPSPSPSPNPSPATSGSPSAAPSPSPASDTSSSSSSSSDVVAKLVKDESEQAMVTCKEDQGNYVCEARDPETDALTPVTITHPGGGDTLDDWYGNPAPRGADACQVTTSGQTRSVVCDEPGATIVADKFTYKPS